MRIGVTRESKRGETRVAATPATVKQLIGLGYDVLIETGAGALSSFADEAYAEVFCRTTAIRTSDRTSPASDSAEVTWW